MEHLGPDLAKHLRMCLIEIYLNVFPNQNGIKHGLQIGVLVRSLYLD